MIEHSSASTITIIPVSNGFLVEVPRPELSTSEIVQQQTQQMIDAMQQTQSFMPMLKDIVKDLRGDDPILAKALEEKSAEDIDAKLDQILAAAKAKPDVQAFNREQTMFVFTTFPEVLQFLSERFGTNISTNVPVTEQKLRNHTSDEFVHFMDAIVESLTEFGLPWPNYNDGILNDMVEPKTIREFVFDQKELYDRFISEQPDFSFLSPKKFNRWLLKYIENRLGVKTPVQWKENGKVLIQFTPAA